MPCSGQKDSLLEGLFSSQESWLAGIFLLTEGGRFTGKAFFFSEKKFALHA